MEQSISGVSSKHPEDKVCPRGAYSIKLVRDGKTIYTQEGSNFLTYWAKNYLLKAFFKNGPILPPLYFGLASPITVSPTPEGFTQYYEFLPTDTEDSHPGWQEFTSYQVAIAGADNTYYNTRLQSHRQQFTGQPHISVVNKVANKFNPVSITYTADPTILSTDSFVQTDSDNLPIFTMNGAGTLVAFFLSTHQTWNATGGNFFSFNLFKSCSVITGDQLYLRYIFYVRDINSVEGWPIYDL